VTDFGAILVRLVVPDREGRPVDVVLGYDDLASYLDNPCFFGATIGRNGNRIANARFAIDGQAYTLSANENENNLHSGPDGFEKKLWQASVSEEQDAVTFSRKSPDGENGFPGNFDVSVTYAFSDDNQLTLTYKGVSDQATVANLTNHSYFNLDGEGSGNVLSQYLQLNASFLTPVIDAKSIPTGELMPVAGTVFDFSRPKQIGLQIGEQDQQLLFTGGYDHNFVTDNYKKGEMREIACAYSTQTGIRMHVSTDLPCVQFYSGNFVNGLTGKNAHVYNKRDGFCLETQVEPNAVNMPSFHSPVIAAGETYLTRTAYRFDLA
jgi:aldose 1-epimerase